MLEFLEKIKRKVSDTVKETWESILSYETPAQKAKSKKDT